MLCVDRLFKMELVDRVLDRFFDRIWGSGQLPADSAARGYDCGDEDVRSAALRDQESGSGFGGGPCNLRIGFELGLAISGPDSALSGL